jgi:hypothetical protein
MLTVRIRVPDRIYGMSIPEVSSDIDAENV